MEADNIIDCFNIDDMKGIIDDQINSNTDYSECGVIIDHLKPLYAKYKSIEVDVKKGITEDDVIECKNRFNIISLLFCSAICNKFNVTVDEFWLENASDNEKFLLTIYLYTYFVVDFKTILIDIIINYINENYKTLASVFEGDQKNQKGATFNSLKGRLTNDAYAVICANIYDVIFYVLDTLDCEAVLNYSPEDYIPATEFKKMYSDGIIGGTFNESIFALVKRNATLKNSIAFEVISYIKTNYKV